MEEVFSFIKFEGKRVEDGYLDARKSGEALIGIDEVLRFFIHQENPELKNYEFEIPVRVQKGSWEALFTESLDELLIKGALAWGGAKYLGKALEKMAENDFEKVGFKNIFKKSFKAMSWIVKMAIHLGTFKKKRFRDIEFSEDNSQVKINDGQNNELWVPTEYLEVFANCPENLFSKLAKIVEEERELVIGYNSEEKVEEVRINHSSKFIFTSNVESEEELFSELKHGDYVEIEGHVTRGNENSNTIGFLYSEHILTCYPEEGNIKRHRNALFSNCKLQGFVDREDRNGQIIEKRPKIRFLKLEVIDTEDKQYEIFKDE